MIEKAPSIKSTPKVLSVLQEQASLIQSINDEYLYWDKVKYKAKDTDPELLWTAVWLSRITSLQELKFGKYRFTYSTATGYIQKALHNLDMNVGGSLGADGIIPKQDKNRYLIRSIMEEAISSSIMEGASTTRKKAKEMLLQEAKPTNRSERMIANNYHTINHIVNSMDDELTVERLLHIHRLISGNTLDRPEEEGQLRDSNDIYVVNSSTSDAVHIPPDFKEVPQLIDDLCVFFNQNDSRFIHPIVKGIIIHFMIGWIHPFADGNGRTARALFYWYLLKNGYWLTEYLSISRIIQSSKAQYEKAYLYTETDDNNLSYFITYNLKAMESAFTALQAYIHRKQQERKAVNRFAKIPNVNERQAGVLKMVSEEPDVVLSVKEVENRFAVSNATARADLVGLVALGFLEEIMVNKKKIIFMKSAEFDDLIKRHGQ